MIVPVVVVTGPTVTPQGQLAWLPGSFGSGSACATPELDARATSASPAAMVGFRIFLLPTARLRRAVALTLKLRLVLFRAVFRGGSEHEQPGLGLVHP
jgi:hypothetical protein